MIEVNDYVRTKNGVIGKVIKVLSNRVFLDNLGYAVLIKDILKHSKQLIDLVEVGDYVNGYKVIKLKDGFANGTMEIVLSNNTIIYRHHSEDIKTILTKEQYMANCYKVGGKQWD
jgi:hypothetical protein